MNECGEISNKEEMRKKMHNGMGMNHGIPDPEKIKEILDVVTEKIPGLLKELSSLLYSPENAKNYAGAAATFYKELKSAGIKNAIFYFSKRIFYSVLSLFSFWYNFLNLSKNGLYYGLYSLGYRPGQASTGIVLIIRVNKNG